MPTVSSLYYDGTNLSNTGETLNSNVTSQITLLFVLYHGYCKSAFKGYTAIGNRMVTFSDRQAPMVTTYEILM
jgi:hypothetical protein